MVSTNSTIDLNQHGEMVKTQLMNGDMVKSQEKSHYQSNESTQLFLSNSLQLWWYKRACQKMAASPSHNQCPLGHFWTHLCHFLIWHFKTAWHLLHRYICGKHINSDKITPVHCLWYIRVHLIHASGRSSFFSKSHCIAIIEGVHIKTSLGAIVLSDGSFVATKFLKHYWLCIFMIYFWVKYWEFIQQLCSDM